MARAKYYDEDAEEWLPILNGEAGATGPTGPVGATGATGPAGGPTGSDRQLQFNDDGDFGGAHLEAGLPFNNNDWTYVPIPGVLSDSPVPSVAVWLDDGIDDPGSGYIEEDVLTVADGNGDFTIRVISVDGGAIDDYEVLTLGGGFTLGEGVYDLLGGSGTGATIYMYREGYDEGRGIVIMPKEHNFDGSVGTVISYELNNYGSGYSVSDVLTIDGGDGNATITIESLDGGVIDGYSLSNPGTGYVPGVHYDLLGGTGSGATVDIGSIDSSRSGDVFIFGGNSIASNTEGGSVQIIAGDGGDGGGEVTLRSSNDSNSVQISDSGVRIYTTGLSIQGPIESRRYVTSTTSNLYPSDYTGDYYELLGLNNTITINNPEFYYITKLGQKIMIVIKDDGTPRTINWGSDYEAVDGLELPSTTIANVRHIMEFVYNLTDNSWDLIAYTEKTS